LAPVAGRTGLELYTVRLPASAAGIPLELWIDAA